MIKSYNFRIGILLLFLLLISTMFAQPPANGENEYRLAGVNPRSTGGDTLTAEGGRGVWVADNPDLDNDGKPEIIVTEYWYYGRVFVYEVIGDDQLELVWVSKKLDQERGETSEETPRSVTVGDFDNNGRQEIIFPIGYSATDSLEAAIRGIYFYEWTGNDNDYGTEPVFKLTYEFIDSALATQSQGRTESGIRIQDIDGDGKSELLYPPQQTLVLDAKLHILEVESGTFENADVVIDHEYTYTGMVQPPPITPDSYVPCGTEIGDVDSDGFDEIIVAGWTSAASGAGLGFIQINGPDSYTDGSVVQLNTTTIFWVKAKPLFTLINGDPVIYLHGTNLPATQSWMYIVEGIVSDQFVTPANVHELFPNTGFWSAWDLGDQDHPTNDPGDGIDLYLNGGGGRFLDIEYDGSGDVTDTSNYNITEIYNLGNVYTSLGGLFNDVFTYPGMDLDNDGFRDIVATYKGWGLDSLGSIPLGENGFHIFFFEWGDSSQSIDLEEILDIEPKPLSIIMPDDYELEQNYPNPFNPTTTIKFFLPISKNISLKIYNALGQEVRTIINNQNYAPGSHTVQWDSKDNNGNPVASGVYVYTLYYGNFSKSHKMNLVR
jgi:hypothetical protein